MVKYQFTSQDAEEQINLNTKFQEVIQRQAKVIEQLQQDNQFLKQQIKELTLQLENTDHKQKKQINLFEFNGDQKQEEPSLEYFKELKQQFVQKNQNSTLDLNTNNTALQQLKVGSCLNNEKKEKKESDGDQNESQIDLFISNGHQNVDNQTNRSQIVQNNIGNMFGFTNSPFENLGTCNYQSQLSEQLEKNEQFILQQPQQQENPFSNKNQPQQQNSNEIEQLQEEIQFFGEPSNQLKIFLKDQNEFQEKVEQSNDNDKLVQQIQLINNNQEQNQQPQFLNDSSQNPNTPKTNSDKDIEILQHQENE